MQPDERDSAYLWDMLDAARNVREFTKNITYHQHIRDRKLQLAVIPELIPALEKIIPPSTS
jgi:uncharacterized protein with HEPN domain